MSPKAYCAGGVFQNQLPYFVVLIYQKISSCYRSLSIWEKTRITQQYFRNDLKWQPLQSFYRLWRICLGICISHRGGGKFLDLECWKYWKMQLSDKYLPCPPCKAISRFLRLGPGQGKLVISPQVAFLWKFVIPQVQRGGGVMNNVNTVFWVFRVGQKQKKENKGVK